MTIQVLHFDVFTSTPGKGNPAGIVLSADNLDASTMQNIAAITGFNDTAFISSSQVADFRIRYFSPRKEVGLCGHATIAAATALHTIGRLADKTLPCNFKLETRAGVLPVTIDQDANGNTIVFMSQTPAQFKQFDGDRTTLMQSIGLTVAELHPTFPVMYGSTGRWTLVVPVINLDAMRRMQPYTERFADVLTDMPSASIHPFSMETTCHDVDMHARHFSAPASGTIEDPVTGTASGVLGVYYRQFINTGSNIFQPLIIEQGIEIGREGRVLVWTTKTNDDCYSVRIAGSACFVVEKSY